MLEIVFCNNDAPIISVLTAFCHADADVVAIAPKIVDAEEVAAVSGVVVVGSAVVDEEVYYAFASRDIAAYSEAFKIVFAGIVVPIVAESVSGGVYLDVDAASVGIYMGKIIAIHHVLRLLAPLWRGCDSI